MPSVDRRSVLRALGAAALPVASGCLGDDGTTASGEEFPVRVVNATGEAITVEVAVSGPADITETFDLPPQGQRSFSSGIDGRGGATLDVFVEDGPSTVASFHFGTYEANVASHVLVAIHEEEIEVSVREE